MLPDRDLAFLTERWPDHELAEEAGGVAVVLHEYVMPPGFEPQTVDLLLRLPFGYPDSKPDMFWVAPGVVLHGQAPEATQVSETYLGRTWQRFSRHLPEGVWRSGLDNLQSYLALIATMLEREANTAPLAA